MSARQTAVSFLAAAALTAIALSIAANPTDAATPVKAAVVNGTLRVTGSPSADRIALRRSHAHPGKLQVDVGDNGSADFTFALSTFHAIDVEAGGGNDRVRIDDHNGRFTNTKSTVIRGQDGNDTLTGGAGGERLIGGRGNDVIDGGGGSDTISGGSGTDTFVFTGSADDENLTVSADTGRVLFRREFAEPRATGNADLHLDGIEALRIRPLAGNDELDLHDLAGTGVARVDVDLASTAGGSPDRQDDTVLVFGAAASGAVVVTANGATIDVDGLSAAVRITHADPDADKLAILAAMGDTVSVDPAVLQLINI